MEKGILGKDKNTDKLLAAIDAAKTETPADKVLSGLGIPNVGKATAKELIRYFGSIDRIEDASVEELVKVGDIGEISAAGIRNFFEDEEMRSLMARLRESGVRFEAEDTVTGSALEGLTICITGTLPTLSRNEAADLIEKNGGKTVSSVSGKTSYLLEGEAAGSKAVKARSLGVPVITEEDLLRMIGEGGKDDE